MPAVARARGHGDRRRRRPRPQARRGLLAAKLGASADTRARASCSPPARSTGSSSARRRSTTRRRRRRPRAAGIPALVEKPPAPDAAGALRLAALTPGAVTAASTAASTRARSSRGASRRTGDLELHLVLHYRRASWRPLQRGEDALLDLGPHLVDLALVLTGAVPLAVRAHATRERAGIVLATSRADGPDRVRDEPARTASSSRSATRAAGGSRAPSRGGRVRGVRAAASTPGAHPLVRLADRAARGLRPRAARRGPRPAGDRRRGRRGHVRARRRAPLGRRRRRHDRRSATAAGRSPAVDLRPAVRRRERRGRRPHARARGACPRSPG